MRSSRSPTARNDVLEKGAGTPDECDGGSGVRAALCASPSVASS